MQHLLKKVKWTYAVAHCTGVLTIKKDKQLVLNILRQSSKGFELTAMGRTKADAMFNYTSPQLRIESTPPGALVPRDWVAISRVVFETYILEAITSWRISWNK